MKSDTFNPMLILKSLDCDALLTNTEQRRKEIHPNKHSARGLRSIRRKLAL
jgi:hypothetical protein